MYLQDAAQRLDRTSRDSARPLENDSRRARSCNLASAARSLPIFVRRSVRDHFFQLEIFSYASLSLSLSLSLPLSGIVDIIRPIF